jgi:hypothetical protein
MRYDGAPRELLGRGPRARPPTDRTCGAGASMKILVAIANHGTKNDRFARRLIDEYR